MNWVVAAQERERGYTRRRTAKRGRYPGAVGARRGEQGGGLIGAGGVDVSMQYGERGDRVSQPDSADGGFNTCCSHSTDAEEREPWYKGSSRDGQPAGGKERLAGGGLLREG